MSTEKISQLTPHIFIWELARSQIELQLDPHSVLTYLCPVRLIDFQSENHTFVFAVPNPHIRDMNQNNRGLHTLYATILQRIYGQPVQLQFLSPDSLPAQVAQEAA